MPDQNQQNFQNHTRLDPPFHFVAIPIFTVNFFHQIYVTYRYFTAAESQGGWFPPVLALLVAFALLLIAFKVRLYALKVQDRLIRLEERLRLSAVLPASLRERIPELREGQLVAIRFAPDSELPEVVKSTLEKNLASKDIKQSIRNWRPDNFRV